jgi:L-ornithine N5-oxygenase
VVATGGIPALPNGIDLGSNRRVFHSNEFLTRIGRDYSNRDAAHRFVVVGSGQSAAEIFRYLYSNYPKADVTAAIRRFAYKPADESHFVNEIFFPRLEDLLYRLPEEKRLPILEAHRDTNYSCVDRELIEAIYKDVYESRVRGQDRFRIRPFLELRGFEEGSEEVVLEFRDVVHETKEYVEADSVVLATGFLRPKMPPIIGNLSPYLHCESSGRYKVSRNYRIVTDPSFEPRIFLQGFCEDSHGLSDTLLSTLPMRANDIMADFRVVTGAVGDPVAVSDEEVAAAR